MKTVPVYYQESHQSAKVFPLPPSSDFVKCTAIAPFLQNGLSTYRQTTDHLSCKALGQFFLIIFIYLFIFYYFFPGVVIIQKPKQMGAGKSSVVQSWMRQIPPHLEKLSESSFKNCSLALSAKSRKPSNRNCSKRKTEIQKTYRKLKSAQSSLGNYRLNPVSRIHMKIILPQRMAVD